MYEWLKFIHVLAATIWVGGSVLAVMREHLEANS